MDKLKPTVKCLKCRKKLKGRSDKKFCNDHCKSAYHYRKSLEGELKFYNDVLRVLRNNRKILKLYNRAGKSTVRCEVLLKEGFNPNFFTHYWKNGKGDVYLFVFEFGFLKRSEHGNDKYVLVKWQEYMEH
ncbi:hypothetical protein [Mangrovimonas sp. YM274]|uniref:hypothetical protein n=1 Tax=Mangrovimonas sp. YM274 TaxID=3070660 RepID=UPI0027DC6978|nr:hypothetical protein [Mangrovimonas sp. YM274]WMI70058.1 hypothetical protein RBH95_06840 [Mangrovimonas sp. YM274]